MRLDHLLSKDEERVRSLLTRKQKQKPLIYNLVQIQIKIWGYSSAGRAPALHAGGQEFESLYLHHDDLIQFSEAELMIGQASRRFKVVKQLCQQAKILNKGHPKRSDVIASIEPA